MRGSIADFVDIQEWAASLLKSDAEFKQFCIGTLGYELSFYSSFPYNQVVPQDKLPCIIFYTEVFKGNNITREDFFREWTLPFVVQIMPNEKSADVNGVISWTSTKDIKKIVFKACERLEDLATCGIDEKDIQLTEIESISTTDIDEVDDLQAQAFVTFSQANTI